ncbi:MAG: SpoVR family protein [Parcubacteria group bacterium]|nr:SpoVR family protein [Parcubacteria group bacterium]
MTLLYDSEEWTFDKINRIVDATREIYDTEIGIPYYPFEVRMISSEQMIDAYVSTALPFYYQHWSFGKHFAQIERAYRGGRTNLALELVANTNPCIMYFIDSNSMTAQTTVFAHAGLGHNAFFRNNYLFKEWTHPDLIVEYMAFAERYVAKCEARFGYTEVEDTLDTVHALMPHGVFHYKRSKSMSPEEEHKRTRRRLEYFDQNFEEVITENTDAHGGQKRAGTLDEPMENILYFIEKNSPTLPKWKRELVRIGYTIAQYFYPQRLTKNANEGYATFTHYYVMQRLRDKGLINDRAFELFIRLHTNVIIQPTFDDPMYARVGHNPYGLSFAMYQDIVRICTAPTEEDKRWFPYYAGQRWQDVVRHVVETVRDDTFFLTHLSPKVIRDFRLFNIIGDTAHDHVLVTAVHRDGEQGYQAIREALAAQHHPNVITPLIEVTGVDENGDRCLEIVHRQMRGRTLHEDDTMKTLGHAERLWGLPVELTAVNELGNMTFRGRHVKGVPSFLVRYPSEGVEIGKKKR